MSARKIHLSRNESSNNTLLLHIFTYLHIAHHYSHSSLYHLWIQLAKFFPRNSSGTNLLWRRFLGPWVLLCQFEPLHHSSLPPPPPWRVLSKSKKFQIPCSRGNLIPIDGPLFNSCRSSLCSLQSKSLVHPVKESRGSSSISSINLSVRWMEAFSLAWRVMTWISQSLLLVQANASFMWALCTISHTWQDTFCTKKKPVNWYYDQNSHC